MSGMSAAETEAFAAGIEGLRAAYPMLTPEMLSETVRAVLGSAGPVIKDEAAASERAMLLGQLGRGRVTGFDPIGNSGNAMYVPWQHVADVFGVVATFGGAS